MSDWNTPDGKGKDWMMTFTGRRVLPLDVHVEDVDILDIAHSTAMQVRYNGHVKRFYSVAEHMVHISAAILQATGDRVAATQGLIHDGQETYQGDMIRPVKNSLKRNYDQWEAMEARTQASIAAALGVPYPFHPIVGEYDKRIIANEKAELFGPEKPWGWDHEPLDIIIRCWDPVMAKLMYLKQWGTLTSEWGPFLNAEHH